MTRARVRAAILLVALAVGSGEQPAGCNSNSVGCGLVVYDADTLAVLPEGTVICAGQTIGVLAVFGGSPNVPQGIGADADIVYDGQVDVADLVQVIIDWGPVNAFPACEWWTNRSDIDNSGAVDVSDLATVLTAWGDAGYQYFYCNTQGWFTLELPDGTVLPKAATPPFSNARRYCVSFEWQVPAMNLPADYPLWFTLGFEGYHLDGDENPAARAIPHNLLYCGDTSPGAYGDGP